jgi:tRNA wybutosine-synthesizing protein 2
MEDAEQCVALAVPDVRHVKRVKSELEAHGALNKARKIDTAEGVAMVYTTVAHGDRDRALALMQISCPYRVCCYRRLHVPHRAATIAAVLLQYCREQGVPPPQQQQLERHLPKKWLVYAPMVLFPANTLDHAVWSPHARFFALLLAQMFPHVTHIGVNQPIVEADVMRRPFNLIPIYGDFGPAPTAELFAAPTTEDFARAFWCTVVQNGIVQLWAPRYTMFSRGNIKEKKRVLETFALERNDVVADMYCGIGYFALSYLKRGAIVFGWELNPWSVEGLKRGLAANGVAYTVVARLQPFSAARYRQLLSAGTRAFIFHESNVHAAARLEQLWGAQHVPLRHINLGLLPTSRDSWEMSCQILQRHTLCREAVLHIHENVAIDQFDAFVAATLQHLLRYGTVTLAHLEKVKTFAPDVWHIVADFCMHRPGAA